jgi:hypothetical protein
MRVRCTFCDAEYDAPVTRAALVLVARCDRCRRARLRPAEDVAPSEWTPQRADGADPDASAGERVTRLVRRPRPGD